MIQAERFLDLLQRDLPAQSCWIGSGILPKRGILVIGAEPKLGKSLIILELARALTTGDCVFGFEDFDVPEPAKVLLVEAEVGVFGLQDRGKKIFKDSLQQIQDNFWFLSQEPEISLDGPGFIKLREIVSVVKPNVILLDPIGRLHSMEENSNSDMLRLFRQIDLLRKAGDERDMSVVLSHHARKPANEKGDLDSLSPHNLRGANIFFANPDTVMTAERLPGKSAKAWKLKVRWTLRRSAPLEDMLLSVNELDDLRVRFVGKATKPAKLEEEPQVNDGLYFAAA